MPVLKNLKVQIEYIKNCNDNESKILIFFILQFFSVILRTYRIQLISFNLYLYLCARLCPIN